MYIDSFSKELESRGIELLIKDGALYFRPKEAMTAELLRELQLRRPDILECLHIRHPRVGVPQYLNPPGCHNPFTPHESHDYSWECDPDSCYCYKMFGYPRLCQSELCRWVWPDGVPNKE